MLSRFLHVLGDRVRQQGDLARAQRQRDDPHRVDRHLAADVLQPRRGHGGLSLGGDDDVNDDNDAGQDQERVHRVQLSLPSRSDHGCRRLPEEASRSAASGPCLNGSLGKPEQARKGL